jgi:hypothetical protein
MAEFGISGAEPSGSATTMLISILYCFLSTHKNLFLDLSIFRQLWFKSELLPKHTCPCGIDRKQTSHCKQKCSPLKRNNSPEVTSCRSASSVPISTIPAPFLADGQTGRHGETNMCLLNFLFAKFICCSCWWSETDYVSGLRPATGALLIPHMIHVWAYRATRWSDIDRKNRTTHTCHSATYTPQKPHGLSRTFAVSGQRLTAWAMAWRRNASVTTKHPKTSGS